MDDTEKRMYEKQLKACMSWGSQRDSQFASESWVKVCPRDVVGLQVLIRIACAVV